MYHQGKSSGPQNAQTLRREGKGARLECSWIITGYAKIMHVGAAEKRPLQHTRGGQLNKSSRCQLDAKEHSMKNLSKQRTWVPNWASLSAYHDVTFSTAYTREVHASERAEERQELMLRGPCLDRNGLSCRSITGTMRDSPKQATTTSQYLGGSQLNLWTSLYNLFYIPSHFGSRMRMRNQYC